MDYWLEYKSKKLNITFTNGASQFTPIQFNGVTFFEEYSVSDKGKGSYHLVIKKKTKTKEDVSESKGVITDMCSLINTYSTFVIGWPIIMDITTPMGIKKYIRIVGEVEGWSSNADCLYEEFRKREKNKEYIAGKMKIGKVEPWVEMEKSPIPDLIEILKKRKTVNPLIRELAKYFSLAKLNDSNVRYLILGKALEIAKTIFSQSGLKTAFNNLPEEIKSEFGEKNLGWLYEMSNFRYETRHAIDKKNDQGMHPAMTDNECLEYTRLSSLVLTYLVRKEFGLETIIWKEK